MKKVFFSFFVRVRTVSVWMAWMGILSLMLTTSAFSQTSDILAVEQTITAFVDAGDNSDAKALGQQLDDNFRIVINRLFGSKEVSIMPKSVYLQKIKSKEFGGKKREQTIHSILINGTVAHAKVTLKGKKMTFISLLTLLKDESGKWLIVSDAPMM